MRDESGAFWLAYECANHDGRWRQEIPTGLHWEVMESWGIEDYEPHDSGLGQELLGYQPYTGFARLRDGTIIEEEAVPEYWVVNDGVAMHVEGQEIFHALGLDDLPTVRVPAWGRPLITFAVGSCKESFACIDDELVRRCGAAFFAGDFVEDLATPEPIFIDEEDRPDDEVEEEDPTPED